MKLFGLLFLSAALSISSISGDIPSKAVASYETNKYSFSYVSDHRPIGKSIFSSEIYFSQSYFEHSSYEYDPHL